MKTQNTTAKEKILIHSDKRSADFQHGFIIGFCHQLDDLLHEYNALELKPSFEVTDIDKIRYATPLNFIKGKVIPNIKNPMIAGQRTTPEKVFDLMSLNLSSFALQYEQVKNFISQYQENAKSYEHKFLFDSAFFILEEGEFSMNLAVFDRWIEETCKVYVTSERQAQVYEQVKKIVDALNILKVIGNEALDPIYCLKKQPQLFLSQQIRRMIKCDESGNYYVNHEFITSH